MRFGENKIIKKVIKKELETHENTSIYRLYNDNRRGQVNSRIFQHLYRLIPYIEVKQCSFKDPILINSSFYKHAEIDSLVRYSRENIKYSKIIYGVLKTFENHGYKYLITGDKSYRAIIPELNYIFTAPTQNIEELLKSLLEIDKSLFILKPNGLIFSKKKPFAYSVSGYIVEAKEGYIEEYNEIYKEIRSKVYYIPDIFTKQTPV